MFEGFAHVGVATHDMTATIDFYSGVLRCRIIADERFETGDGGVVRQVGFNVGAGQYIVFMEGKNVDSIPEDFDTGINPALGVPGGLYHYSFRAASLTHLQSIMKTLAERNVDVSEITDLGAIKSIFFNDPNGLQLEVSAQIRDYDESDIGRVTRAEVADPG